jgi:hypothetical protein
MLNQVVQLQGERGACWQRNGESAVGLTGSIGGVAGTLLAAAWATAATAREHRKYTRRLNNTSQIERSSERGPSVHCVLLAPT